MNEEEFRRVLERIATALEQIALHLTHPRFVVQDGKPPVKFDDIKDLVFTDPECVAEKYKTMRVGSHVCDKCGGLHSPTVLCPSLYRTT